MEIFVLGAAHSGKSDWVLTELEWDKPTTVIGTAVLTGLEERIHELKSKRNPAWIHIEGDETDLAKSLKQAFDKGSTQILVDALNLWLANFLIESWTKYDKVQQVARIQHEVSRMIELLSDPRHAQKTIVIVSSEVGSGVTPPDELARFFRQQLGWVNQKFAAHAEKVVQIVSGIPLIIKNQD